MQEKQQNKQVRQALKERKNFDVYFNYDSISLRSKEDWYRFDLEKGTVTKNKKKFEMDTKTKLFVRWLLVGDKVKDIFFNSVPLFVLVGICTAIVVPLGIYASKENRKEKEQYKQEIIEGVINAIKQEQNAVLYKPQNQK